MPESPLHRYRRQDVPEIAARLTRADVARRLFERIPDLELIDIQDVAIQSIVITVSPAITKDRVEAALPDILPFNVLCRVNAVDHQH